MPIEFSIIIPAFNEDRYIGATLDAINAAVAYAGVPSEIIVVDNNSTDSTAATARSLGALGVREDVHNISMVRNRGATDALGAILVFVDADTRIPQMFLERVHLLMKNQRCIGGAAAVAHSNLRRP